MYCSFGYVFSILLAVCRNRLPAFSTHQKKESIIFCFSHKIKDLAVFVFANTYLYWTKLPINGVFNSPLICFKPVTSFEF